MRQTRYLVCRFLRPDRREIMSKNNTVQNENVASGKKKLGKKGLITVIVSAALLFCIVVGVVVGVIINKREFNFEKKDLTKYVTVPEELFKSFNVSVNIPEITEKDVIEEIYKLQCAKKITPEGPVYSKPNVTISAGDVAYLYYRGYTMENGIKTYFDGGCNYNSAVTSLEIGSGSFIPGFESGLIGKNQQDYATIDVKKSGFIADGDIITIKYSVIRDDNTIVNNQTVTIDLNDPNVDQRWGEGFKEYFVGRIIDPDAVIETDERLIVPTVCEGYSGQDVYHSVTILSACSVDDSTKDVLIVEAKFPNDDSEASLKGKTAYFEVFIKGVDDYEVYDFDDRFITEELKVTAEDLSSYAGDTLVEKYKAYMLQALKDQREADVKLIIEESFWTQIMAATEVKKLPQKEVDKVYDNRYAQLVSLFDSQGSSTVYANDFDGFACAFLDLSTSADWKAYLRKDAEEAIKEKLIFYYIVQTENLIPTEEEYNAIYEVVFAEHLQDYLDYYKITPDIENYEKELEKGKKEVLSTYGDSYFYEVVMYDYVMTKIVARANVTITA